MTNERVECVKKVSRIVGPVQVLLFAHGSWAGGTVAITAGSHEFAGPFRPDWLRLHNCRIGKEPVGKTKI